MNAEKVLKALVHHVPAGSVDYCMEVWHRYDFDFRLRKSRVTKVGDFTIRPGRAPRITVNQDLHPYLFLTTYLHEVAHVAVHRHFGNGVAGHGHEWKTAFQQILEPVLTESIFPQELLFAIRRHMADPPATTFSDPELTRVFRKFDPEAMAMIFLSDIPEGAVFGLRGRWFKKGKTQRTRALCQEVKSKRKYLVPVDSPVENVQLSLL